jgi:V/A-type H+/Na+-transporting ATPase subunit D
LAFTGRTSPTRGALVKLRANLEFVQNALAILKLKRDRLAEELNLLLKEMARRDIVERKLMENYADFQLILALLGHSETQTIAYSAGKMKVQVLERPIVNVLIPEIRIETSLSTVFEDPSLYKVSENLQILITELLDLACKEASIERIAYELTSVNRKINALEKNLIPSYQTQIKYIEDFLSDEELEDFTRIKHVKAVSGRRRS